MKRALLVAAALCVIGGAQAAIFTTVFKGSDIVADADLNPVEDTPNNKYTLEISNFNLDANGSPWSGDVQWTYDFDSSVPFNGVWMTMRGTIEGEFGWLEIHGGEKVRPGNSTDGFGDLIVDTGFSVNVTGTATETNWEVSWFMPFKSPANTGSPTSTLDGRAQKDILTFVVVGAKASVDEIEQQYSIVPEPASLAAIGIGILGFARKRRNR